MTCKHCEKKTYIIGRPIGFYHEVEIKYDDKFNTDLDAKELKDFLFDCVPAKTVDKLYYLLKERART